MDYASSRPGSSGSDSPTPLRQVSNNQQRDTSSLFTAFHRSQLDDSRDSSVHEKISQFNTLAMQSKQLERKTADAALKRAMLGREEAEAEMRRYREEARQLRRQAEEGRERERKVGERLEQVMETYGRAKETHAHTQALWEKEIRRARKETFKAQSALVKVQEELKGSRTSQKQAEDELEREKERGKSLEQEVFSAKYNLVSFQEQLGQALERIKMLEQEREALKIIAKNEEDARIAAEGRNSSSPEPAQDEGKLSSSTTARRVSSTTIVDIDSKDADIEELVRLWEWEKQRADRAVEHVDFLETECRLKFCPAAKVLPFGRRSFGSSSTTRKGPSSFAIADGGDLAILSDRAGRTSPGGRRTSPKRSKTDMLREQARNQEARQSTVFVPAEGIFRTVSMTDAEVLNSARQQQSPSPRTQAFVVTVAAPTSSSSTLTSAPSEPPTPADAMPPVYARTPSVEPPDFAKFPRASLLSLLDAPHEPEQPIMGFHVPTTPGPLPSQQQTSQTPSAESETSADESTLYHSAVHHTEASIEDRSVPRAPLTEPLPQVELAVVDPVTRPHTSASHYSISVKTTTTKVPLREESDEPSLASKLMKMQRTPSRSAGDAPSFDVNNPALTPTMTREQALAQIRERRGRARSVGKVVPGARPASSQSVVTPRRPAPPEKERQVSAPTGRVGILGVTPSARRVRS